MDRRTAIKHLSIFGSGMLLAPSCTFSSERVSVVSERLKMTPTQEDLLANIVEVIIPSTNIPGAKKLKLNQFVLIMIKDCHGRSDQEVFKQGLEQINAISSRKYGKAFSKCEDEQKQNLISQVIEDKLMDKEGKRIASNEIRKFLLLTKRYTIQGFLQSEFIMTEINPYQLVPGHFDGCVSV